MQGETGSPGGKHFLWALATVIFGRLGKVAATPLILNLTKGAIRGFAPGVNGTPTAAGSRLTLTEPPSACC